MIEEPFKIYECLMCGEILDHVGRFCSEQCAEAYYYQNRTCETCGGEFWDGGTSCTCENWDDDENDFFHMDDDYYYGDDYDSAEEDQECK